MEQKNDIYDEQSLKELRIFDSLKSVIDPELGINIIDMGLVYSIKVDTEKGILISMTFSSEGCPMGDAILDEIYQVLNNEFPQYQHKVEITFTPKWTQDNINANGRKMLGLY